MYVTSTCSPRFPSDQRARVSFFYIPMCRISYSKQPKSFSDQITLLKQRGLIFLDEAQALHLLQNIRIRFLRVGLP